LKPGSKFEPNQRTEKKMENLNIDTVLATGAQDTATGSRMALRGMIWFGFGYHTECNLDNTAPATYNRRVNAALQAAGRGKGEGSTKAKQACVIGDAFPKMFGAELASEYATTQDMVQACFNAAEASGAGSVLRLIDWAKHGDPDYTAKAKATKAAEKAKEKQDAIDAIVKAAEGATALPAMSLDTVASVVEVQNLNLEPEVMKNTIADKVSAMSDEDLAMMGKIIRAEIASRKEAVKLANAA
jgi:uncharacterized protein (UPF0297 family)